MSVIRLHWDNNSRLLLLVVFKQLQYKMILSTVQHITKIIIFLCGLPLLYITV